MTLLWVKPGRIKKQITMKKIYLKPEVVSMNVAVEAIMIGTSGGSQGIINPGGNVVGPPTKNSDASRGEWGNVWGK